MKISIGADHRGFDLKRAIIDYYKDIEWVDVGTTSTQRTDYPVYAQRVCRDVTEGRANLGILICGSGAGICIAANRHKNIYAATCWTPEIARLAREDDNVNVLVLPADFVSHEQAFSIIDAWLKASFKDGVYKARLDMIDKQ